MHPIKHKKNKEPRQYTESQGQKKFFKLLYVKYPKLRHYCFSIPNAGKRAPTEAKRMKAEGLTKGVLDCMLAYPSGKYAGLFIEFKSEKGTLTSEQKQMFYRLCAVGYRCFVCRTADDAMTRVEEYLEADDEFLSTPDSYIVSHRLY